MQTKNRLVKAIAVISAALAFAPIAHSAENEFAIEEIVVTAQKRAESIQDVPVSISALSGEMADNMGADSIDEIIPMVPGLTGSTGGLASNTWAIRGISSNDFTVGGEPSVGVFIDDAYIGRNALAVGAYFDIDRIEVVKGPQGTLFGRNAAAGAISIITKKPEFENSLKFGVGVGNEGQQDYNVMGNLAASDEFAVRFSYHGTRLEGIWREVTFNEEGFIDQDSLRLSALWMPSDGLTARLTLNYSDGETNMGGLYNPGLSTVAPGEEFPDTIALSTQDRETNETDGANLRLSWDLNENLTLTSITDARSFDFSYKNDADNTADDALIDAVFAVGTGGSTIEFDQPDIGQRSFSQEFRLNGARERVDWFVGLNYFNEKVDERTLLNLFDTALGLGLLAVDDTATEGETDALGVYGDVKWAVSDAVSLTAGLRWSQDKKDWCTTGSAGIGLVAVPTVGQVCGGDEWSEVTPRVVVEYAITPDAMSYASFSKGYKGGGFNPSAGDFVGGDGIGDGVAGFEPETIDAFELGLKSTALDGRLQFNAAAYFNDYTNLQVLSATLGGILVTNAAEAETQGVELEATYMPAAGLTLMGNYSYLDTEFKKGEDAGNALAFSPENTLSLGAAYEMELNSGTLSWFAIYTWQDDFFYDAANLRPEPDRGLLAAKVTYRPDSERWDVALGAQNITDEDYTQRRSDIGLGASINRGMPRLWKVELNAYF